MFRRRRKAAWGWEDGGTVVSTGSQWAGSGRDLGPEAAPSQVTFEVWMESLFPFPFTPTSTPQRVGQASEHYRKLSSAGAQLVSRLVGVWEVPGRPVITVSEQHIAAKPRGGNSEMETERRKLPGESGQVLAVRRISSARCGDCQGLASALGMLSQAAVPGGTFKRVCRNEFMPTPFQSLPNTDTLAKYSSEETPCELE